MRLFVYMFCIISFFSSGCTRRDGAFFQKKASSVLALILYELEEVETLDDLLEKAPPLEQLFCDLINITMEARLWQDKNNTRDTVQRKENKELSSLLRQQMNRIYRIQGASALFEKIQRKALERLDAFEKKLARKRHIQAKAPNG